VNILSLAQHMRTSAPMKKVSTLIRSDIIIIVASALSGGWRLIMYNSTDDFRADCVMKTTSGKCGICKEDCFTVNNELCYAMQIAYNQGFNAAYAALCNTVAKSANN
jgi:hypothetical protein